MNHKKLGAVGKDSILNIVGAITSIMGLFPIANSYLIYGSILVIFGLIIILYSNLDSLITQSKISNFIIQNQKEYNRIPRTPFVNLDDEKKWMFLNLAEKYPKMTIRNLKLKIDKHYETISI